MPDAIAEPHREPLKISGRFSISGPRPLFFLAELRPF